MFAQRKYARALATGLAMSASLLLAGCGAGEQEPKDEPRIATGSTNKQGLWRMTEEFDGETFYSTVLVKGTGNNVTMTDCSRAFETDSLVLAGSTFSGYNFDLAALQVLNNDRMRWSYSNQTRQFEKMDVNPQFNMGDFSLTSPLLPNVMANVVCAQFSATDQGEVLVLTTQVQGNALMITINMKNGFETGIHNIEPFGNERAMVFFSGSHWVRMTLTGYNEISSGTVNITKRGQVWIEGEVKGVLRNGFTPVTVKFHVETPVN